MHDRIESCLIIGAGISGLLAARSLREMGMRVRVLEKGRGVGGRLATRRIENAVCDHGAQFFTVRSDRFRQIVDELLTHEIVVEWARGFASDIGHVNGDGHPRYRGVDGMNGIAKYLAQGIDIHCNQKVAALRESEGLWHARTEAGESFTAEALILTPPVEQSLALLDAGEATIPSHVRQSLESITYDPCLALMALTESQTAIPEPGGIRFDSGPISWIADNFRKGISNEVPSVTIHASPDFSRAHWNAPADQVAEILFRSAESWIQSAIRTYQLHRWRYSQPVDVYPEPCLMVDGEAPLIFAGDAFGGPRVEGASLSGLAAADALHARCSAGNPQM